MKLTLFLCFLVFIANSETFDEFKSSMEQIVANLTIEMEDIYRRRCETQIATCQTFSYYQCNGHAAKKCYEDFPQTAACVGGGAYLAEGSAVRFPEQVDVNSLSDEEKEFVCTSALLEESFKALDQGRNKRYGRSYIGTSLGSFRSYPATGGCEVYDPRFRPWYVAATAGAKNVLIIVDISGSMMGERMSLAIDAAKNVVNTLGNTDFVGVVKFDSTAYKVYSNKILRATEEVKNDLLSEIGGFAPAGGTNYESGFRAAFKMLQAARRDEFGAPCTDGQNIFLFLTDGQPNEGATTSSGLIGAINEYGEDITLFTYALGSGASTGILQDLACEYSGIMFQISDSASSDSSIATVMRNYYTYVAEGLSIDSPVWTEPYEDAFGLGRMVTVSMPVYYEENSIRKILGVIGLDVSLPKFQSFGFTQEQITKKLIQNAPCHRSNLTECEIDELRSTSCGISGCSSSGSILFCADPPSNIFLQAIENNGYICCGLSIALLVIIIVLGVAIIIVIACVVRYKMKKSQQALQQQG